MPSLKYPISQLPGESQYRQFFNELEKLYQDEYREYQDFRMNIGLSMNDIDAVVHDGMEESFNKMRNIEYIQTSNGPELYAILEMKYWRTKDEVIQKLLDYPSANSILADRANLPFFVVKYFPPSPERNYWEFSVYPVNQAAKNILKTATHMSERRYIKFMYEDLRHQTVPINLLEKSCQLKNSNFFSQL